jgi:hypothetical protein
MTVKMSAKFPGLTGDQVKLIETMVDQPLPADYRAFLLSGNVYVPEENQFSGRDVTGKVAKFLGLSTQRDEDIRSVAESYADRVPGNVLPIALAGGGNLLCLHVLSGAIYFWDHEAEAGEGDVVDYSNLHYLADSFSAFLLSLVPASTGTPEGTVVSVRLKPGFAEKFKDYT